MCYLDIKIILYDVCTVLSTKCVSNVICIAVYKCNLSNSDIKCLCTGMISMILYSKKHDQLTIVGLVWFGCFGLNGPLRQYFSLYRAVSQREGEREEKG